GFADEDDLSVWQRITAVLDSLWRVAAPDDRHAVMAWIAKLVEPVYRRVEARARSDRERQLRATLFSALGRLAGRRSLIEPARTIARDGHDDPALVAAALTVSATHGTVDDHRDFTARLQRATSPQEEERLRGALTEFTDADAFETTLAMCADGRLRTQDAP